MPLTLSVATIPQLGTGVVVLLQCFLEVEDAQIVLPHSKVDAAQIVPEHATHTLS